MNARRSTPDEKTSSVSTRSGNRRRETARSGTETLSVAALQQSAGNQAVQSALDAGTDTDDSDRPTISRSASAGRLEEGTATDRDSKSVGPSPGPTADMCPRCIRRYRAGKSLNCSECESEIPSENGPSVQRSPDTDGANANPAVSDPSDASEREAERVAREVVRTPSAPSGSEGRTRPFTIRPRHSLCNECQRRVRRGADPNCSACEATLRRSPERDSEASSDTPVADRIAAARSGGRDLPESVRSFFEPRFGRAFDDVSIHTGPTADEAARAINAEAFTLGTDIVFRSGAFRPETRTGKRLIGHELTHVVQQGNAPAIDSRPRTVASPDSSAEREADRVADRVARGASRRQGNQATAQQTPDPLVQRVSSGTDGDVLHRKLTVADPSGTPPRAPAGETNESIVEDYVEELCSEFTVESGDVTPKNSDFCGWFDPSPGTESCECLCEMHELDTWLSDIEWTIEIDDSEWPHSDPTTNTVYVHSPYSGVQFGSWTGSAGSASPHRGETDNWLILAHELCGHVLPIERGTHPAKDVAHGGRRHHDFTIRIQNEIAREHGVPSSELRGLFSDPHHGESLASVTVTQFPLGGADVGTLPTSQQQQIALAKSFIDSASVKLDVIGHAGPGTGTSGENTRTSLQRAQAVRDELVSRGVDRGNIMQVTGVGDRDCPSSGRVPSCRKVEIYMFSYEGASGSHGP